MKIDQITEVERVPKVSWSSARPANSAAANARAVNIRAISSRIHNESAAAPASTAWIRVKPAVREPKAELAIASVVIPIIMLAQETKPTIVIGVSRSVMLQKAAKEADSFDEIRKLIDEANALDEDGQGPSLKEFEERVERHVEAKAEAKAAIKFQAHTEKEQIGFSFMPASLQYFVHKTSLYTSHLKYKIARAFANEDAKLREELKISEEVANDKKSKERSEGKRKAWKEVVREERNDWEGSLLEKGVVRPTIGQTRGTVSRLIAT